MDDTQTLLDERFSQLPEAVKNAITSADVSERLRKLSDTNDLHLDQWQELETEVMLTLMGIKPVSALEQNIKTHVKVSNDVAAKLAQEISTVVFAPVREEMERFLSHPSAKVKEGDPIQDMTGEILKSSSPVSDVAPTPAPSTPAPALPTTVRKEAPAEYKPAQVSSERKDVHSDPYRVAPDT
jgi:hypothetical protein